MANSKDVVVTGVSTGIGWGTTKVLVSKGFRDQQVRDRTAALRLSKRVWLCRAAIHHAVTQRLAHRRIAAPAAAGRDAAEDQRRAVHRATLGAVAGRRQHRVQLAGFDRAPGARPFLAHARLVGREPHAPRRRARVRQRSSKGFAGGRKTLTLTRTPKRISVRAVTRNEVTPDAGRLPGD